MVREHSAGVEVTNCFWRFALGPAVLAAPPSRKHRRLPPVGAPQLGHVPAAEAVRVVVEPVAQPGRAGRRSLGRQQAGHESDNLVAGECHVAHQQADQPGQGEAHQT